MKIIDGKNRDGKRVSISMDSHLWSFLSIEVGNDKNARAWIRAQMVERDIVTSRDIRYQVYRVIFRPEVVKIVDNLLKDPNEVKDD